MERVVGWILLFVLAGVVAMQVDRASVRTLPVPAAQDVVVGVALDVALAGAAAVLLRGGPKARPRGRCEVCGYDLRATPERCPECGAVPWRGRFTAYAQKAMGLAGRAAEAEEGRTVDTEHILSGVLRVEGAVGRRVLEAMGVDVEGLGRWLPAGEGWVEAGRLPRQTVLAKRVIHLAIEEAKGMGHEHVGTEHLVLGLLGVSGGKARGLLEGAGVKLRGAREKVVEVLGPEVRREPYWNPKTRVLE